MQCCACTEEMLDCPDQWAAEADQVLEHHTEPLRAHSLQQQGIFRCLLGCRHIQRQLATRSQRQCPCVSAVCVQMSAERCGCGRACRAAAQDVSLAADTSSGSWQPVYAQYLGRCLLRDVSVGVCAGLLHTDFMHLAGSLLPWAVLACILELSYGSARVALLWLVTLLGGAFTSAVLDPPCQAVRARPLDSPALE